MHFGSCTGEYTRVSRLSERESWKMYGATLHNAKSRALCRNLHFLHVNLFRLIVHYRFPLHFRPSFHFSVVFASYPDSPAETSCKFLREIALQQNFVI